MDKEINAIIDNLCEKFGTTTQFLVPEYARYAFTRCAIGAVFSFIALAALIVFVKKCWANYKEDEDELGLYGTSFALFLTMCSFIAFAHNTVDAASWAASPYGAFVAMLVRMLK